MFFIVLLSTLYYLFAFKLGFPGKPVQLSFKDIRLSVEKPGVYETVELDIRLNGSVSNPFDENEVNVTSEIILPNGVKWNMPAFFYQNYERRVVNEGESLLPSGEPFWKLRFTPILEGSHSIVLRVYSRGELTDSRELPLEVKGYSHNPGFVRLNGNY